MVELLSPEKQKWTMEPVQILVDRKQRTKQEPEANLSLSRSCPLGTYFCGLDRMSWGFYEHQLWTSVQTHELSISQTVIECLLL